MNVKRKLRRKETGCQLRVQLGSADSSSSSSSESAGWRSEPTVQQRLRLCFLCVFPVCLMSGFWGCRRGEQGLFPVCDGCQARDPRHEGNSHCNGPPMSVTGGQAAGLHIRTLSQTSVYRSLQNVQQRFLPSVRRSPLPVWAISPDGQRPQDLSDGRSPPTLQK